MGLDERPIHRAFLLDPRYLVKFHSILSLIFYSEACRFGIWLPLLLKVSYNSILEWQGTIVSSDFILCFILLYCTLKRINLKSFISTNSVRKPLLLMCTTRKMVFVRTKGVGLGICLTMYGRLPLGQLPLGQFPSRLSGKLDNCPFNIKNA